MKDLIIPNEIMLPRDYTELVIRPEASRENRLAHNDMIMVMDTKIQLRMSLQAGGREVMEYVIVLEASDMGGFDDALRCKLLQHPYLNVFVHCPREGEKPDWDNIHVRVEDPHGILTWLFPGGNFSYLTNQLRQHGDRHLTEPLRLPAAD
jgi:hypothetical protein